MKTKTKFHPFGLRVLKTALAVTLSVMLVRQFVTDSLSVFYAAFGALIAMDTTFTKSLMQGLTQLVGVLAGTVFGYVSVLLFPGTTPAWLAGLGVLLLIVLCISMKLPFTASLSCIIFLSACLTPTDDILRDSLFRLRDTSVGVGIALLVNAAIRPYNNKKRILSLLIAGASAEGAGENRRAGAIPRPAAMRGAAARHRPRADAVPFATLFPPKE